MGEPFEKTVQFYGTNQEREREKCKKNKRKEQKKAHHNKISTINKLNEANHMLKTWLVQTFSQ